MRWNKFHDAGERIESLAAATRERLRRLMPRVVVAAVVLSLLWLFLNGTTLYRGTPLGLLGPLAFLAVALAVAYYGTKALLRLKDLLLWRVRRRLMITTCSSG